MPRLTLSPSIYKNYRERKKTAWEEKRMEAMGNRGSKGFEYIGGVKEYYR